MFYSENNNIGVCLRNHLAIDLEINSTLKRYKILKKIQILLIN